MNKMITNMNIDMIYRNKYFPVFLDSEDRPQILCRHLDNKYNDAYFEVEDGTRVVISNKCNDEHCIAQLPMITMSHFELDVTGDTLDICICFNKESNQTEIILANTFWFSKPKIYSLRLKKENGNEK